MSQAAITVDRISKRYRLGVREAPHQTFREAASGLLTSPLKYLRRSKGEPATSDEFWALKDVSFEVQRGEVIGIIGRNGAGKSTLLKILSRITEPASGEIRLRGRVASLLEIGTGFHADLTGRENIYLNGAILGMKRAEIRRKFDEIVDFAEVEKFLDTPVKFYSSGMYVRLAFAVAAHLEPEILIVDEVLAVGDAEFQKKCLGKIREVSRGKGRTVLFVSHNMAAINVLCTSAIVLDRGALLTRGTAEEAIAAYAAGSVHKVQGEWRRQAETQSALSIELVRARVEGSQPNHRLHIDITASSNAAHASALVAIDFFDLTGVCLMQAVPTLEPFIHDKKRTHEFSVEVDLPPLIPGRYRVGVWMGSHFSQTLCDVAECVEIEIIDSPTAGRSFPHHNSRGYVVPTSRFVERA